MALIYVEGHGTVDIDYGTAGEVLPEGDLVAIEESTQDVYLADAGSYDYVTGIALHLGAGDTMSKHEYDYDGTGPGPKNYEPASAKDSSDMFPNKDDDVPVGGQNPGNVMNPRTIEGTGVTTAPNIQRRDVVGVVDTTVGDAPADPGQIVEEGYTADANGDGTTTTFSRANGNFIAIGRAEVKGTAVTSYGERVRVDTNAEY